MALLSDGANNNDVFYLYDVMGLAGITNNVRVSKKEWKSEL